jgi:predicted esterase
MSVLLFIGCATTDQKITLDTRNNVTQGFYVSETEKPLAVVILFRGGKGKIHKKGIDRDGNFLVRSRSLFTKNGFVTVTVDAPSDKQSSDGMFYGFRNSNEHVQDIDNVIKFLKEKYKLPIWLVGTSRGTESATNIAIHSNENISGLILTSSMAVENNKGTSVTEMDLSKIKMPTLVVAHNNDECSKTPPYGAKIISKLLINAKPLDVKMFDGGDKPISKPCNAKSYHGFLGIEEKVVDYIADFIKSN